MNTLCTFLSYEALLYQPKIFMAFYGRANGLLPFFVILLQTEILCDLLINILVLLKQVNNISGYLPGRIVFFLVCCKTSFIGTDLCFLLQHDEDMWIISKNMLINSVLKRCIDLGTCTRRCVLLIIKIDTKYGMWLMVFRIIGRWIHISLPVQFCWPGMERAETMSEVELVVTVP